MQPRHKRIRSVRRDIQRIRRDISRVGFQMSRELDPARLMQLREQFYQLQRIGASRVAGVQFQESRCAKPDGPSDCPYCNTFGCAQVPVAVQRRFEDALRIASSSPAEIWMSKEFEGDRKQAGIGHGVVLTFRSRHFDHVKEYEEWKRRQADRSQSKTEGR